MKLDLKKFVKPKPKSKNKKDWKAMGMYSIATQDPKLVADYRKACKRLNLNQAALLRELMKNVIS